MSPEPLQPLLTIGHSNRELNDFIQLLLENAVEEVIDVRKLPGSARYPQFNADTLGLALAKEEISFSRIEALTGRRPVSKTVPFEVNGWWSNQSFHNYADHALSDEFRDALTELQKHADTKLTAVMCSEAVWWRCHRRIIADHLLAAGRTVQHILGAGNTVEASLSGGAKIGEQGIVTYPQS